jgi:sRNA-binding carbon storage regulator CsrA
MELRNLPFEQAMTLRINNQDVEITVFKTCDDSNIKFGINAPPSVQIDREESVPRR